MNKDFIEELLIKTDLVGLISKYVRLEKRGDDYWGCCPFHHEKTPSFKTYAAQNSFHCFGCKASGNAITFLQKIENIDWIDAVKLLAEQAGMELPRQERRSNENYDQILAKKERLYSLLQSTARFYHDNLKSPEAEPYRRYLVERGIDERLISRFGIGASLDWTRLISHLRAQGYTDTEMKEAGVAGSGEDGLYDTFKGRIMFPIIDAFGKVVSFSGRIIDGGTSLAKYKNGAATLVFNKSKVLFGINLLKKKKRKENIEYVILVEGHIDVVMMHKAGFDTTVASMGTALTHAHAKQLKNICSKVFISYDGDAAGSKATLSGLDILAETGINVRVINLPTGLDPDDVIKKFGESYYRDLMENAETLTAYKISSLAKQFNLSDPFEKSKFAVSAVRIIKSFASPIEREEYLTQIAEITGYTMSALKRQAEISDEQQEMPTTRAVVKNEMVIDSAAVYILAHIAQGRGIPRDIDAKEALSGVYLEIYEQMMQRGLSALYSIFDESMAELIGTILNYDFCGSSSEDFLRYYYSLLREKLKAEKEELSKEYDISRDNEILQRINALDKRLNQARFGGR